jgi:hypothetical protein
MELLIEGPAEFRVFRFVSCQSVDVLRGSRLTADLDLRITALSRELPIVQELVKILRECATLQGPSQVVNTKPLRLVLRQTGNFPFHTERHVLYNCPDVEEKVAVLQPKTYIDIHLPVTRIQVLATLVNRLQSLEQAATAPWERIFQVPGGHTYFKDLRDGRIAVADRSGSNPDKTEDGPLWLDHNRWIALEEEDDGLVLTAPVVNKAGKGLITLISLREAFYLVKAQGMRWKGCPSDDHPFTLELGQDPPPVFVSKSGERAYYSCPENAEKG